MTLRAAAKRIGTNVYGVMRLMAEGEFSGEKVHNAAGGHAMQVSVDEVEGYLARRDAPSIKAAV